MEAVISNNAQRALVFTGVLHRLTCRIFKQQRNVPHQATTAELSTGRRCQLCGGPR